MPIHGEDLISSYMRYFDQTEVPNWYTRWSILSGIGALLSRNFYFQHGHFKVYPNQYVMFIGEPGTKKSTAIKQVKSILKMVDYTTFAPNKTSKEKFLAKLADQHSPKSESVDDILDQNIFGDAGRDTSDKTTDCFICADEFNNFLGNGNIEFISILGELWDYDGLYENELKNGRSDYIPNPTISILSGNTQTNFQLAFPPETLGQGFFSRLLLIYCDTERARVTFPPEPTHEQTQELLAKLVLLRNKVQGKAEFTPHAMELLDKIYKSWTHLPDPRFTRYSNRRLSHLIKLALVLAAANYTTIVTHTHLIHANTILTHAEHHMPAALGEFGKAKNSDVVNKIVKIVETHFLTHTEGITFKDLFVHMMKDLDGGTKQLGEIVKGLVQAEVIHIEKNTGWILPKKRVIEFKDSYALDWSILTDEEKGIAR